MTVYKKNGPRLLGSYEARSPEHREGMRLVQGRIEEGDIIEQLIALAGIDEIEYYKYVTRYGRERVQGAIRDYATEFRAGLQPDVGDVYPSPDD